MDTLPVSIERALQICNLKHSVNNDLAIFNFNDIPIPKEYRHMECIFVGVCVAGAGQYSMGTVKHPVKKNDVLIVGQGQILGDIEVSRDFECEALLISPDFFQDIIRDTHDVTNLFVFSREHPVITLETEEVTMFKEYLAFLKMKVDDHNHLYRRQITGTLIGCMVYDLCNAIKRYSMSTAQRATKSYAVFEDFIKLVETHFRHERRVSWYSEQLGMSPKTLLEMIKRASQRTPNEWLDIYTTLEIRLLLRHTSKSIKEIAEELNFGSQSSLGKFFREHVGISPTAYRHS